MGQFQGRHIGPAIKRVDSGRAQADRQSPRRAVVPTTKPGRGFVVSLGTGAGFVTAFTTKEVYTESNGKLFEPRGESRRQVLTTAETKMWLRDGADDRAEAYRFEHRHEAAIVMQTAVMNGFKSAKVERAK